MRRHDLGELGAHGDRKNDASDLVGMTLEARGKASEIVQRVLKESEGQREPVAPSNRYDNYLAASRKGCKRRTRVRADRRSCVALVRRKSQADELETTMSTMVTEKLAEMMNHHQTRHQGDPDVVVHHRHIEVAGKNQINRLNNRANNHEN